MKLNKKRIGAITVALAAAAGTSATALAVPAIADGHPTTVSSISVTGYPKPAQPTVTVTGVGFGAAPTGGVSPSRLSNCHSGTGLDYGPSKLWFLDATQQSGPGLVGAFQEGANQSRSYGNCGGIVIESWSSTKAVFTFGSRYASDPAGLQPGDPVCVSVKGAIACTRLS